MSPLVSLSLANAVFLPTQPRALCERHMTLHVRSSTKQLGPGVDTPIVMSVHSHTAPYTIEISSELNVAQRKIAEQRI
jgi:hypothetical protein